MEVEGRVSGGMDYVGEMLQGKPHGKGKYTFPNGTVYEGDFADGMFHGKGVLTLTDGGKYKAEWAHGKSKEGKFTFADGLSYNSGKWKYCEAPDRRFHTEHVNGIKPAGESEMRDGVMALKAVPKGALDLGDGYFLPEDGKVHAYEGKVLRDPDVDELDLVRQKKLAVGLE